MADEKRLLVQIGTYNANLQGNLGLPQDLVDWLAPTFTVSKFLTRSSAAPDIVAIGFQELLPLHFGLTGLSRSVVASRDALIRNQIEKYAPNKEAYSLVAKVVNCGVALLVYAHDEGVGKRVTDVQTQWTGLGPAWMGNKGAVAVRFRVTPEDNDKEAGEVFTFVNAHLTAHTHNNHRRIQDIKAIVSTLLFPPTKFNPNRSDMYQSTHLFVLGDLNFRLDLPDDMAHDTHVDMIGKTEGREALRVYDQLTIARREGKIFHGLREGEFWTFPCSFKYKLGSTHQYDAKRVPSWTDRILFATATDSDNGEEPSAITPLLYTSIPSYTLSDHKPVVAVLLLPPPTESISSESHGVLAPHFIQTTAPHPPDPMWRAKRWIGKASGWSLGWIWCFLWLVGLGNWGLGLANVLIGGASFAFWRRGVIAV